MRRVLAALLASAALAGCGGTPRGPLSSDEQAGWTVASPAAAAPPVRPLAHRARPDVLVVAPRTLPRAIVDRLHRLSPAAFTTLRVGTVYLRGAKVGTAGVDPSVFREFAPAGTAEATPVWQAIARGEAVLAHDLAARARVALAGTVPLVGRDREPLRLGALATVGLADLDVLVSDPVAARLGLAPVTGVLLSSARNDPAVLAAAARQVVGTAATIHLLTQPRVPVAFLTGSRAASAFGAFSYRYYDDGTIVPDARWVAANIVTARVPILGYVTCHRLMLRQLRAALGDVQAAGLAGRIHTYNGCYVPRFIERDPSHPVSLHTWGIAIDLDAATNRRGIRGTLDAGVVAIFKRWGFRWGGDWSYTDPMHFELGALLA